MTRPFSLTPLGRRVVAENLGLVGLALAALARVPAVRRLSREDADQAGRLGLTIAAGTYDPARGTQFSTYAVVVVRNTILTAAADDGPLYVPPDAHRHPGTAGDAARARRVVSLDALAALLPGGPRLLTPVRSAPLTGAEALGRALGREDGALSQAEAADLAVSALDALGPADREVLRLHFWGGLTAAGIARLRGLTKQAGGLALRTALAHAREALGVPPPAAGGRPPPSRSTLYRRRKRGAAS